jgi:hypothetical protein
LFPRQHHCTKDVFWYNADENSVLLGHYADSDSSFVPTIPDNLSFPSSGGFLTPEVGTDRFSRNVGNKLPLPAA